MYIGNVFRQDGLRILYDSAEGRYLVSRENPPLGEEAQVVKLVVFADDKELQEVNDPTYHRYITLGYSKVAYKRYLQNWLETAAVTPQLRVQFVARLFPEASGD